MHIGAHIMSGWCLGNCFKLDPRRRACCIIAASVADLDGLGRVVSMEAYWKYHHILCHNLLFCIVVAALLSAFSARRIQSFMLYLALGHLHLLMDYLGSGPLWGIAYFWPFSPRLFRTGMAWEFYSWQNLTVAGVLFVWVIFIAIRQGRTPIETIAPDLDRRFVGWLRAFVRASSPAFKGKDETSL
ncbi:MAG TPA: metal-dependent hydrolase [Tepidisphaeraceae bacterium]|nr:metal-dependent hydrolase [Tepidisphaeraceae bacterium]